MIRAWIKSSVYPQRRLEITTQGGADYNHSSISLDGTSPADILFLHVLRNGSEVEPAPEVNVCEGFFDWSIDEVPLVVGLNELLVLGFDGNGDMVDSDSIQVMLSDVQAFVRGDGNDDGSVDLVDVLWVLFYAFDGSVLPRCEDALDVDDSSVVDYDRCLRASRAPVHGGAAAGSTFSTTRSGSERRCFASVCGLALTGTSWRENV